MIGDRSRIADLCNHGRSESLRSTDEDTKRSVDRFVKGFVSFELM